jgi:hypothetical protein
MVHPKRVEIARQAVLVPLMAFLSAINPVFAWDSFVGQESCTFVVEQMQAEEDSATLIVAAFISGVNYATGREIDGDVEGMVSWVREYCERNPSARFLDALAGLDGELDARQAPVEGEELDESAPLVPGEDATRTAQLTR